MTAPTTTAQYRPPHSYAALLVAVEPLMYMAMVLAVYFGRPGLALGAALLPTLGATLVNVTEKAGALHTFNPKNWSFLFGDLIALPWLMWWAAAAREDAPAGWHEWPGWIALGQIIGFAVALIIHFGGEKPWYQKHDASAQFNTKSKWWHDFATYPAFAGAVFFALLPLLLLVIHGAGADASKIWSAFGGLLLWLALAVATKFVDPLMPDAMHPPGKQWTEKQRWWRKSR